MIFLIYKEKKATRTVNKFVLKAVQVCPRQSAEFLGCLKGRAFGLLPFLDGGQVTPTLGDNLVCEDSNEILLTRRDLEFGIKT